MALASTGGAPRAQDSLTSALIRSDRFVAAYGALRECLGRTAVEGELTDACPRHRRAMQRVLIEGGVEPESARGFVARLEADLADPDR